MTVCIEIVRVHHSKCICLIKANNNDQGNLGLTGRSLNEPNEIIDYHLGLRDNSSEAQILILKEPNIQA